MKLKIVNVLVVLALVMAFSLATAVPAMASSTLILRPNAAGDEQSINFSPGWAAVADVVPDEDASYVQTDNPWYERDLYNITDHTTESGVINSVTIYYRISGSLGNAGNGFGKPSQKSGGIVTDGTQQSAVDWTTLSQTYTTNPATGAAYTWSEIDALQVGVSLIQNDVSDTTSCTQVYVVVDYTSPPAPPPVSVGGTVYPVNKIYVLLPWFAGIAVLALLAGFSKRYFVNK
jgi:hypothetical protein